MASASASAVDVLLTMSEKSRVETVDVKQAWCRASSLYLTDVLLLLREASGSNASSHFDMRDLAKSSSVIKKLIHGRDIKLARDATVRLLLDLGASEDTMTSNERFAAAATSTQESAKDVLSFATLITRAISGLESAIQLGDLALTGDIIRVLSDCSGNGHAAELSDVLGSEISRICAMTACTSHYDLDGPIELLKFSAYYGEKLGYKYSWAEFIVAAIQHRRADIFCCLWKNSEDLNTRTKDGATILTSVLKVRLANFTNLVSLQTLLSKGADPDLSDAHQTPPISLALQLGLTPDFEVLLAHGASLSIMDKDGNTPLHVAVMYNRQSAISILLQHPRPTDLPRALEESSPSSPALTSSDSLPRMAGLLLKTHEHQNHLDSDQIPDPGSEYTSHDSKQQLAGTMYSTKPENYINSRNHHGYTPLHVAVSYMSEEGISGLAVCQELLATGADPKMGTAYGELPIFMALRLLNRSLFLNLLPFLLRYGADIDSRDCRSQSSKFPRFPTALQIAAYHGAADLVLGLLQHGATCNTVEDDDVSSLHFCAMELEGPLDWKSLPEKGRKDLTAQYLIRAGADILAKTRSSDFNERGWRDTPLDLALHEHQGLNNSISIVLIQAHHAQLSGPLRAQHHKILQEVFEDAVESESPECFLPLCFLGRQEPFAFDARHLRKWTVVGLFLLARIPVDRSALCTSSAMNILAGAICSCQKAILECYIEPAKLEPILSRGYRTSLWDRIKDSALRTELNRCLSRMYLETHFYELEDGLRMKILASTTEK